MKEEEAEAGEPCHNFFIPFIKTEGEEKKLSSHSGYLGPSVKKGLIGTKTNSISFENNSGQTKCGFNLRDCKYGSLTRKVKYCPI